MLVVVFTLVLSFTGYVEAKGSFGGGSRGGSFSRSFGGSFKSTPTPSITPSTKPSFGSFGTKAAVGTAAVTTIQASPSTPTPSTNPVPIQTKMNMDLSTLQKKKAAAATYQKAEVVNFPKDPIILTSSYKPSNPVPSTYSSYSNYNYAERSRTPTTYVNSSPTYNSGLDGSSLLLGYVVGNSMNRSNNTTYVSAPTIAPTPITSSVATPVVSSQVNKEDSGIGWFGVTLCILLLSISSYLVYRAFTNSSTQRNKYYSLY